MKTKKIQRNRMKKVTRKEKTQMNNKRTNNGKKNEPVSKKEACSLIRKANAIYDKNGYSETQRNQFFLDMCMFGVAVNVDRKHDVTHAYERIVGILEVTDTDIEDGKELLMIMTKLAKYRLLQILTDAA